MKVSEIFGPTLQGEGPNTGRPAVFLRLGNCNLSCNWCDTPYTWDASRFDLRKEITNMGTEEVTQKLLAFNTDRLVVTGGEPLLQQRELAYVLAEVAYAMPHIEVETNGTRPLEPALAALVGQFNVSPKLAHAGNGDRAIVPSALREMERTGKALFKFVVADESDLSEVDRIVADNRLTNVWLMPEGTTPEAISARMRWVCDAAIVRGWSVSSRLHILAWNDERGR